MRRRRRLLCRGVKDSRSLTSTTSNHLDHLSRHPRYLGGMRTWKTAMAAIGWYSDRSAFFGHQRGAGRGSLTHGPAH